MAGGQPRGHRVTTAFAGGATVPGKATAKVVALLGVAGSGKSAVTRRLVELHGFTRLRFVDTARDMLKVATGLTDDDLDSYIRNKPQQRFGGHSLVNMITTLSRWGRDNVHADFWANEWRRKLDSLTGFVVTDDVMRHSEAAAVWAANGLVIRVTRPGYTPPDAIKAAQLAAIPADMDMDNEGPQELAALVDSFMAGIDKVRSKAVG